MDQQVIEEKLEALRRAVKRIEDKCPNTPEGLKSSLDLQDIIAANLIRAVQLCVDIAAHIIAGTSVPAPGTMGESFERLVDLSVIERPLADRLRKAVGFRNIAVPTTKPSIGRSCSIFAGGTQMIFENLPKHCRNT